MTRGTLVEIIDYVESQSVLFIESRLSKDSDLRMTTHDFRVLNKGVTGFIKFCRSFANDASSSSPLKGVLQTQANKFATKFHEERKKKLSSLLDIEQWRSMDSIAPDFQSTVDSLVCSSNSLTVETTNNHNHHQLINSKSHAKNNNNYVLVSGEKFLVVNSVVLCLSLLIEYVSTAQDIPSLAPDLLTRVIDLLKLFNSRSLKLVLGGEAKQVSGLKSVTSRVLINCSRAVTLLLRILPPLKKSFESLLTLNGATLGQKELLLGLFDETSCSLKEHTEKITEKLLNSNRDFFSAKLSKWEPKPPVPSPTFQSITQHLSLLDANLEDVLPERELALLFKKLDAMFKEKLREQLDKHGVSNDGGPMHGYELKNSARC
jgi:vacuolar protein sorting-associated protein 54